MTRDVQEAGRWHDDRPVTDKVAELRHATGHRGLQLGDE
jgi:hypothetical protein